MSPIISRQSLSSERLGSQNHAPDLALSYTAATMLNYLKIRHWKEYSLTGWHETTKSIDPLLAKRVLVALIDKREGKTITKPNGLGAFDITKYSYVPHSSGFQASDYGIPIKFSDGSIDGLFALRFEGPDYETLAVVCLCKEGIELVARVLAAHLVYYKIKVLGTNDRAAFDLKIPSLANDIYKTQARKIIAKTFKVDVNEFMEAIASEEYRLFFMKQVARFELINNIDSHSNHIGLVPENERTTESLADSKREFECILGIKSKVTREDLQMAEIKMKTAAINADRDKKVAEINADKSLKQAEIDLDNMLLDFAVKTEENATKQQSEAEANDLAFNASKVASFGRLQDKLLASQEKLLASQEKQAAVVETRRRVLARRRESTFTKVIKSLSARKESRGSGSLLGRQSPSVSVPTTSGSSPLRAGYVAHLPEHQPRSVTAPSPRQQAGKRSRNYPCSPSNSEDVAQSNKRVRRFP